MCGAPSRRLRYGCPSVPPNPPQYLVTYDFQGGLAFAVNYYGQMSTYATNYYERKVSQSTKTLTMSDGHYCCHHHSRHCCTPHQQRVVCNEPRSRLTSDLLWLIPCWPSGHMGRFADPWFLSKVKVTRWLCWGDLKIFDVLQMWKWSSFGESSLWHIKVKFYSSWNYIFLSRAGSQKRCNS